MTIRLNRPRRLNEFENDCYGAVLLDQTLTVVEVTDGLLSLGDFERGDMVGYSALDFVHPDDVERASEALAEAMSAPGPSPEGMYRMRFADESYHALAVRATSMHETRTTETVFQFAPVSARLRAEEFASDTVNTLRMLAESHELADCLERVHRLAERHAPSDELHVATLDNAQTVHHVRVSRDHFEIRSTADQELPAHVERALALHRQGPWRLFNRMALFDVDDGCGRVTAVLIDDDENLIGYFVVNRGSADELSHHEWMVYGLIRQVLTVVLRRVRLDIELRHVADSDPLTGLVNRRRLLRDMAEAPQLEGTALLLIDLDHFSWFNNTLGHQVGDQALIALADQLGGLAPADATVGRFGGDEFVVWLPGGIDDARVMAEQIHVMPVRPAGVEDLRATVRSSVGGVTIEAGESATEAIGRADLAMYTVKDLGGDDSYFA